MLCDRYLEWMRQYWKETGLDQPETGIEKQMTEICAKQIESEITERGELALRMRRSQFAYDLLHGVYDQDDDAMRKLLLKEKVSPPGRESINRKWNDETKKLLGEIWSLVETDYPEAVFEVYMILLHKYDFHRFLEETKKLL